MNELHANLGRLVLSNTLTAPPPRRSWDKEKIAAWAALGVLTLAFWGWVIATVVDRLF
jgi:hypothetical protein